MAMNDLTMAGLYVRWQYAGMVRRCTEWCAGIGSSSARRNWVAGDDRSIKGTDHKGERSVDRKTSGATFRRLANFLFKGPKDSKHDKTVRNIRLADEYAETLKGFIDKRLEGIEEEIGRKRKPEG